SVLKTGEVSGLAGDRRAPIAERRAAKARLERDLRTALCLLLEIGRRWCELCEIVGLGLEAPADTHEGGDEDQDPTPHDPSSLVARHGGREGTPAAEPGIG